ncbi:MAG TPA: TonB-dependent receptor [Cyclobacteriaceae bacterium]|nr:TonB-dependent receptor [Cyclobacteriaceae bacterium]
MKRRRPPALSFSTFLLLLLIVLSRASLAAVHVHDSTLHQDVEVTGQVTDASGEAIPGVTVLVKGTTIGTATDIDGQYAIAVPEEAVLVFSFVGYISQELAVGTRKIINVTLEEDVSALDEIVVVGYGTQRKVNVTGSISVVDNESLQNRPLTNATQALQGVQGLYVNQAGGQPGADDATIRIRGIGSIGGAGKLSPLVLVDGVEFPLRDVNPNDIESISVLKDAASTAIYGSRAANGVILITTKLGKEEQSVISYSGYIGSQQATYLPDPVDNSADFMEAYNRAMINQGTTPIYSDELINEFRTNPTSQLYPNTNWMELMFGSALIHEHNLRFSGGTSKTRYNVSTGFLDQDGVLKGMTGAKKYSLNVRVNSQLTERLNMEGSVIATRWDVEHPASGIGTAMNRIMRMVPVQPVGKLPNGNWPDSWVITPGQNGFQNPLIWAEEAYRNERTDRIMANLSASYQLAEGLRYQIRGSVNSGDFLREDWYPAVMAYDVRTGEPSRPWSATSTKTHRNEKEERLNFTQTLTYDFSLGSDHTLFALLGHSLEQFTTKYFQASVQGFPTTDLDELDIGTENPQVAGTSTKDVLISYFGRVQYGYKDKYLLEFNSRYDGSSRFAKGNKWGFFPSFSLGWRLSEENFLSDARWLDELKIRGSWGQIGNQEIGRFQYINAVELGYGYPFGGAYQGGSAVVQLRDPSLQWEVTSMTNVGVDFALLQGKLSGELEYFHRRTEGILRQVAIPSQVGALAGPIRNIAVVDNSGFELGLNYTNQIGTDFSYEIGGNFSKIKNEVVDLNGEEIISGGRITREGAPIDSWYVLKTDGLFQSQEEVDNYPTITNRVGPGDVKYVDLNEDGVIDGDDRYIAGNTFPEFTYGFNFTLRYKGLSLSTIWQGVGNIHVRPNNNLASPFNNGAGLTKDWLTDSWTPENPNARLPRITARNQYTAENFSDSDFWLEDASYLRLKNVQLAYDFKGAWLDRIGVDQLRLFVNAQNILTFTNVRLFDPERNITATNIDQYPSVKTTTVGVNINF